MLLTERDARRHIVEPQDCLGSGTRILVPRRIDEPPTHAPGTGTRHLDIRQVVDSRTERDPLTRPAVPVVVATGQSW